MERTSALLLMGIVTMLGGCTARILAPENQPSTEQPDAPGPTNPSSPSQPDLSAGLPAIHNTNGLRPLTRREYAHSVQELLGVEVDAGRVPVQTLVEGHGGISAPQEITRSEVQALYEVGLSAAEQAVAQLGCRPLTEACAQTFAEQLLARVFYGAQPSARQAYLGILQATEAGETTEERLITLITATLNAPEFLYRTEAGDGAASLDDHEIAARLSFLIWETPPDAELIAAAEQGTLRTAEGRRTQLMRLLNAPQAKNGILGFVRDWMGLVDPKSSIGLKDPEVLVGTSSALAQRAAESLDQTIQHTLLDTPDGRLTDLLVLDALIADPEIGELLTLTSEPGSDRYPLPTERQGILLHPEVLAGHTAESGVSPFPIGEFVFEHVLCGVIGSIPMLPDIPAEPPAGTTMREYLEQVTSAPGCQACHAKIGPPGFAFLNFDPLARVRPGVPVSETAGELALSEGGISFDGAAGLSAELATHPRVQRCVARRLFRWTHGRFEGPQDAQTISALETVSMETGTSLVALLDAIVTSDSFTQNRMQP